MKNIAILGSTGSIGTQTLDVVRKNNDLRVVAVSAGRSVKKLEQQIREFHPLLAAVWDEKAAEDLKIRIADTTTKVVSGMDGLLELASMPESDILVTAIVGMIGIRPTMEGIRAGKDIALANKETLVTAGHLIMPMAKEYGVSILPVDSEHSAIFQAIHGEEKKEIHKLLITASGGPFRGRTTDYLKNVTVADTLKHPNWVMGQKITVDSATLVNKGLEVMEAKWLFDNLRMEPLWPSLEHRICVSRSSTHCTILTDVIWMETVLILRNFARLLLRFRIWRHSVAFQWLSRHPEKVAVCQQSSMQPMSWQ